MVLFTFPEVNNHLENRNWMFLLKFMFPQILGNQIPSYIFLYRHRILQSTFYQIPNFHHYAHFSNKHFIQLEKKKWQSCLLNSHLTDCKSNITNWNITLSCTSNNVIKDHTSCLSYVKCKLPVPDTIVDQPSNWKPVDPKPISSI